VWGLWGSHAYWRDIFENRSDETLVCSLLDGVGPNPKVTFEKAEDLVCFVGYILDVCFSVGREIESLLGILHGQPFQFVDHVMRMWL
jgi:hypothetical protein